MNFKVGDTVVCIDARNQFMTVFKLGKVYTVEEVYDNKLQLVGMYGIVLKTRFRKLTKLEKALK